MLNRLASVVWVGVLALAAAWPTLACAQSRAELEAALRREAPALMARYHVPGVAIALAAPGRATVTMEFGVRDAETGAPVRADTPFQVGSISKFATAVGVLHLVDQGRLELHTPVEDYLQRWHAPPSEFATRAVDVASILNHTSGFSVRGYFPGAVLPGPVPDLLSSLNGTAPGEQGVRLLFAAGSQFSYSGGGYSVLQLALEDGTGEDFARLMRAQVFAPLRLRRTGFDWSAFADDMARPHGWSGRAIARRGFPNQAAAGLAASARDLTALIEAAIGPGYGRRGLLSPASSSLLATQTAPADQGRAFLSLTQAMLAPETWPNQNAVRYGPGALIAVRADGRRFVGHSGSNAGWKANLQIEAESGEAIAILTNSETGNGVILPLVCRWRQWLDAEAGMAQTPCPEHAAAYLLASFGAGGAAGAEAALREIAAAPEDAWLFNERTASDVASQLDGFAPLDGVDAAAVRQAQAALLAANADLFPDSAYAQAGAVLLLAYSGDRAGAIAAADVWTQRWGDCADADACAVIETARQVVEGL